MIPPHRFLKIRPEDRKEGTIGKETMSNIGEFIQDQYERIPEDKRQGFEQGLSEAATGIQEWNRDRREVSPSGMGPLDPFIAAGMVYNTVAEPIKKELSIQTGLAPSVIEVGEVAADFLLPAIPLTGASKAKKITKGLTAARYKSIINDVYSKNMLETHNRHKTITRFSTLDKQANNKNILDQYVFNKAQDGPYKSWQSQDVPFGEVEGSFITKEAYDVAKRTDAQFSRGLNPDQLKLFDLPTDPAGKEAFRIFSENIAVKSGYESMAKFKREVLNTWPQKDVDQLFRELWSNHQYEGYIEHLTAKGSHMDWYWNMKGLDRNAVNNVRILYNDNLKNLKDTVEKIVYGSPNNPGLGWQSPNLADRLIVSFEDPMKRAKVYNRQNPGDIIIKRAGNDQIIGNLGQYLDTLYPQDALAKRMFEDGVAKLGLTPAEFRRQILEQRIGIIIENSNTLPKNATKRKRYIKQFIDDDMVDLTEQYPFLQSKQSIKEAIDTPGSGITEADYDLRGQGKNPIPPLGDPKFQKKGPFPSKTDMLDIEKAKRKGYTQGSIFDQINNILRPDRIDE